MDKIIISDLEVRFHVGVPDEERAQAQRLLIGVEMTRDFSAAAHSDDLTATIDYYRVTRRLLAYGEGRSWKLIEKLAADIADMILREFKPTAVSVEVKKFIIPEARYIAVRMRRDAAGEIANDG